jgi:GTP cyclohydrolase II
LDALDYFFFHKKDCFGRGGSVLLKHNFIETKLATKFGQFNLRVYSADPNKETLALWTDKLDVDQSVLVRVHSECITGDTIGSLQCDCGEQLSKSLQMIDKEGGVLIYLRQEGRGIGLFEKIKSYQLQSKGYDTFEANVLLGHRPDERTYEMVKTVLDDFNIKRIRLLTNNPSKVSEIAKQGVEVVERVPLVVKANKHNKFYFSTKRNKFQHSFKAEANHYFYQFHAETAEHVEEIGNFFKNRKKDPLLKICVGVSAGPSLLTNDKEIERIKSIFLECTNHEGFCPVLHFSFLHSLDTLKDLESIKEKLPFVNRLQINDIPSPELPYIKRASELFTLDIPVCDDNFDLVYNKQFRNIIAKHKAFVLLDNSKGRGIQESKDSLMRKIETLLGFGLNNIGIYGGFGPNDLDRYFELKRYYKINFSIDAETKLKTKGKIDLEKVKLYLLQLTRSDDPKKEGLEQTRKFLKEHRRTEWAKTSIESNEFLIHPKVFHAGFFPSSAWFARKVRQLVKNEHDFCEVGCGSGVISCLVALANPEIRVVATDINPHATENTRLNAEALNIRDQLQAVTGDVLDKVSSDKPFDSIFWALPFGYLDPGTKMSLEETQVCDPGYRAIRKFFQTAKEFLKPGGRILIGFSPELGHAALIEEFAKENLIELKKIDEKVLKEDSEITFEIIEGKFKSHKIGK